uniref:Uncharacterized protein n=1 Tax=Astyanax mexicanus TaxID=7994 RepID=A0A8B9LEV1_ASTMX
MDGSSLSSLSEEESSTKQPSLPEDTSEHRTSIDSGQVEDLAQGERLLSGEEQLTLITESMSITSADEEKLQLLNKNTELRRLNKELMKLNEDWDHIYRSTSAGLQQRVAALEQENTALKQLNSRLLLKVEHEQNKSEYYEHTLMQELKKNQHLQEYVRLLESRLHRTDMLKDWTVGTQNMSAVITPPEPQPLERPPKSPVSFGSTPGIPPSTVPPPESRQRSRSSQELLQKHSIPANPVKEVQDLKEQLKVYEDDFHRERSDKQILQRLLMKKAPGGKDPVLVHRCNNDQERPRGEKRRPRDPEQRAAYICPKHSQPRTPT